MHKKHIFVHGLLVFSSFLGVDFLEFEIYIKKFQFHSHSPGLMLRLELVSYLLSANRPATIIQFCRSYSGCRKEPHSLFCKVPSNPIFSFISFPVFSSPSFSTCLLKQMGQDGHQTAEILIWKCAQSSKLTIQLFLSWDIPFYGGLSLLPPPHWTLWNESFIADRPSEWLIFCYFSRLNSLSDSFYLPVRITVSGASSSTFTLTVNL